MTHLRLAQQTLNRN